MTILPDSKKKVMSGWCNSHVMSLYWLIDNSKKFFLFLLSSSAMWANVRKTEVVELLEHVSLVKLNVLSKRNVPLPTLFSNWSTLVEFQSCLLPLYLVRKKNQNVFFCWSIASLVTHKEAFDSTDSFFSVCFLLFSQNYITTVCSKNNAKPWSTIDLIRSKLNMLAG